LLDLTAYSASEQAFIFEDYTQSFIRRPFRLAEQSPLRAVLAVLNQQEHILLLNLHHIASDRWSVGVLMQEVAALYPAFCANLPSPLPALAIQYADYCVWQREIQSNQWHKQQDYWQTKLTGVLPLLELPTDYARPAQQSYRGEQYAFAFSVELTQGIKQLAQQQNATLFMVMATAFSTLLYRYSQQNDFCIGYPVAGRNRSQTAHLIGFFVNTLVLRCQLNGATRFVDYLASLREQALNDQNHQELAFGQLLESLNVPRKPAN
jgi:non-ribosomal peptide synthetase component F